VPDIDITTAAPISLTNLIVALGLGVVIAILLSLHYRKYGSTLSNREEFSRVFLFIILTTILIISVVKSSLALSLGLVGALSIVRFRTPIKEPEELAYLFIAIASGLGLGADQRIPTMVAVVLILTAGAIWQSKSKARTTKNLYLSIEITDEELAEKPQLEKLCEIVSRHSKGSDLRRVDRRENLLEATFFVDLEDADALGKLMQSLNELDSGVGVSFIDQTHMPTA
jgi:uncharacterized membrane protein YhiD involved in acid resistance